MKFPVNEAIISGDWLQCATNTYDGEFLFRLRPISFSKVLLSDIDTPDEDDGMPPFRFNIEEGVLWLLKIEIVNLNKTPAAADYVLNRVALIDQDDFMFEPTKDDYLTKWSKFAKSTGLNRFINIAPPLNPKIKTIGTLTFQLPDDEHAKYYISLTEGNVQAV